MRRSTPTVWASVTILAVTLACNAPTNLPLSVGTSTPTPASEATATTAPTLAPTPTPIPTPTPTPTPSQRLLDAAQAMHNGDYETAIELYRSLLDLSLDDDTSVHAQFGLATAYLRNGDYGDATQAFREFLAAHPGSGLTQDAHFLLGEALVGAGEPLLGAGEYRVYVQAGTVITAYVNALIGDALQAADELEIATEAYLGAVDEAPSTSFEVGAREKLALVYTALERYDAAVAQYDAILESAQIQAYRARIEHEAAATLILAGETDAGYDRHLSIVETYPETYYAYLSLVELVEAGRPVDDLLRGMVDYHGGAYGPAVEALYRYINAYPETHSGDAHWYAGLSFLAAGSPDLAAGEFRMLIDTHPDSSRVGDAWMGLAQARAEAGDVDAAVATYRDFARTAPEHIRAPEALWNAAQLLERSGELGEAAEAYLQCQARHPSSEYGPAALFRSGLQSYRLDEPAEAADAWSALVGSYADSPLRSPALLWLGKARLAQDDAEAAVTAFERAAREAPHGYYGLRASDLSADPLSPAFASGDYGLGPGADQEQKEAEEWLAEWLELESAAGLSELSPDVTSDPHWQRGTELWRLGRFEDAKGELETLRRATVSDALAQYQLSLAFRNVGLYRSSILCAERVVHLSPVTATLDAPAFVARLAYPVYFEDLVLQDASQSDLDPLLVLALIRQESLFESFATSTASAHGLMQVIPSTGQQIAAQLGWPPGYEAGDLYHPYVSLRFGTYYLAQQRDRFDGRLDAALAGYNGGPGNAQRWLQEASEDPDLLLELITFAETRLYLQRIKEHLAAYQALYGAHR